MLLRITKIKMIGFAVIFLKIDKINFLFACFGQGKSFLCNLGKNWQVKQNNRIFA